MDSSGNSTFLSMDSSNDTSTTFMTCLSGGAVTLATADLNQSQILEEDEDEGGEHFVSPNGSKGSDGDYQGEGEEEDDDIQEDWQDPMEETEIMNHEGNEEDLKSPDTKHDDMIGRVLDYSETCNSVVMNQTDKLKTLTAMVENETKDVINERDQALMDLRGVEQAFSDVHRKYERAKLVLENLKMNEELLRQRDEEFQLQIASRDQKREAFKQEIQSSLDKMYNDFQAKLGSVESDNGKLTVLHRRAEMRVETLESELAHKQKENRDLNTLADDLIGKSANAM